MEKEGTDLPDPPFGLARPISNPDTNTLLRSTFTYTSSSNSSTTTSSSSSPPALRQIQAAYKRHRPLGTNNIMPKRMIMPRRGNPKASDLGHKSKTNQDHDERLSQKPRDHTSQSRNSGSAVGDHADYALSTPPVEWGYSSNTHEAHLEAFDRHDGQPGSFNVCQNNAIVASNNLDLGHLVEGKKRVHFASENEARSLEMDDILSHMGSLALTEMECDANASNYDLQQDNIQSEDVDNNLRQDSGVSSSMLRDLRVADQLHQFRDLVQDDMSHPMSQSSLINPDSAPILSSTTYSKCYLSSSSNRGTTNNRVVENNYEVVLQGDVEMNIQPMPQTDVMQGRQPVSNDQAAQLPCSKAEIESGTKLPVPLEGRQTNVQNECNVPKNPSEPNIPSVKDSINSCGPPSNIEYSEQSDMKSQSDKTGKLEAGTDAKGTSKSRKKSYDPELFFKVNGKLYQRLGKIGSGGSSEVHKVISSDCTIYALKKIKLKGRDYATAYGFCQEILYLTKLKGKNYIIQLIDYEVTDKALLQEVINGSQGNKDARVKVDGFIYMVLEYGEIDLAHMLSNKWKELDKSSSMIDENWLRFYWQQILLAVNTIHEERIVHSDLKPANFLLVRGSLKLIDFGIAKAIMSDTTNIQRDSQVGTLSYMSPEAFMCNETDANGNTIKCGRASDIWSLGCILYQMVYGRTPFSEYKTFWAKFKVITDPNHEITYEPVSNPWLLDLMKKCLSWDRNQRWRIPQLLLHPFLVPPIPPQITSPLPPTPTPTPPGLRQLHDGPCKYDPKTMMLSSQLEQLLMHPTSSLQEQQKLLCDMSNLCLQLNERLGILGKGEN